MSPSGATVSVAGSKVTFTIASGQTIARWFTFRIPASLPRGHYTVSETASDLTGAVSSSATLTLTVT